MGKGACIKRMVAVRNYSTNTIMEKNKQGDGGRFKDNEFSRVKFIITQCFIRTF